MQGGCNTSPTLFFLFQLSTLKKNQSRSLMQLIKWLNYCWTYSLSLYPQSMRVLSIHCCSSLDFFNRGETMARKYISIKIRQFLGLYFDHMHGFWGFISILTEQEMGFYCKPSRCIDSFGIIFIPRNPHI